MEGEDTNPFGTGVDNPGMDDGDETELAPLTSSRRGSEDAGRPSLISTSHDRTHGETLFTEGVDEHTPLIRGDSLRGEESLKDMERGKDEAERRIRRRFPRAKFTNPTILTWIDEYDRIMVKLSGKGRKEQPLFDANGEVNKKVNDTIRKSLGPLAVEIVEVSEEKIAKATAKKIELRSALETANENQRESLIRQDNEQDNIISGNERVIEETEQGMRLKDRIKAIFKKYGFTLIGVLTAVGTVIGVIVSNLKQGLTTLGKGVGGALKSIGKKLGEILPGLVGAIASFVFKTAGEVIGFLGKNAWLLFVGVVVFLIERLKKKTR